MPVDSTTLVALAVIFAGVVIARAINDAADALRKKGPP